MNTIRPSVDFEAVTPDGTASLASWLLIAVTMVSALTFERSLVRPARVVAFRVIVEGVAALAVLPPATVKTRLLEPEKFWVPSVAAVLLPW
ncbi:hypothetical protein [Methylobacterium sp. Leaf108]|uniref:hypothetical protein n=1 Tax=Methylobacterium sp. Leaf108 TaxID=1736256 RepID=UPI001FCDE04F|nr:hypothetical protein [Methylobacterium sp. Leaf108]